MQAILASQTLSKVIIISALLFTTLLFVCLFKLITGSFILAILIHLGLIYLLLKNIGAMVMYPGSSFYTRSDIQIRFSKDIANRIIGFLTCIAFLNKCIYQRKYGQDQSQFDLVLMVPRHINYITQMLQLFQITLSQRKTNLLRLYRQIRESLNETQGDLLTLMDFVNNPHQINRITLQQVPQYAHRFNTLQPKLLAVYEIVQSYAPPHSHNTIQYYKFRAFGQYLYQIRFGFHSWKYLYEYQLNMVETTDKQKIQTTVIYKQLTNNPYAPKPQKIVNNNTNKTAVLFCNPNGVFIQFFGADNEYIKNYLRLGFHVILWNYRGYSNSTGSPSIANSQIDARKVLEFYQARGFQIKIVHGYSIGGAAAIGLMEQLAISKQQHQIGLFLQQARYLFLTKMSIQFGDILHRLTKIVFFMDNMDLSLKYQQLELKKLLIWDNCDEVIPDRASVKNCIIKRRKQGASSKLCSDQEQQRGQLTEEVQTMSLQQTNQSEEFAIVARKIQYSVKKLIQASKYQNGSIRASRQSSAEDFSSNNQGNKIIFDEQQSRQTQLTTSSMSNQSQNLMTLISTVDGGGVQLFANPEQLVKIISEKPEYFYHICQSYVLGLVCYGSYLPLCPVIHNHTLIKTQTINKINSLIQRICKTFNVQATQSIQYRQGEIDFNQIVINMLSIYIKLGELVQEYFAQSWFARHGSLLPTRNGHNANLSHTEYMTLNTYLRNSLGVELQEKEAQSQEMITTN